jgi:hypothetical protein
MHAALSMTRCITEKCWVPKDLKGDHSVHHMGLLVIHFTLIREKGFRSVLLLGGGIFNYATSQTKNVHVTGKDNDVCLWGPKMCDWRRPGFLCQDIILHDNAMPLSANRICDWLQPYCLEVMDYTSYIQLLYPVIAISLGPLRIT